MKSYVKAILLLILLSLLASCSSKDNSANQNSLNAQTPVATPTVTPRIDRTPIETASPSETNDPAVLSELVTIKRAILRSTLNGDSKGAASYLTDDYKNTKPDGTTEDKTQYLANLKPVEGLETFLVDQTRIVSLKEDLAVMRGLVQARIKGSDFSETFMDTFVKKQGHWLLQASKSTGMKKD